MAFCLILYCRFLDAMRALGGVNLVEMLGTSADPKFSLAHCINLLY